MKFLEADEALSWFSRRGIRVTGNDTGFVGNRDLDYTSDALYCYRKTLNETTARGLFIVAEGLVTPWEDGPFEGGLLWIRETGIWGEQIERTAAKMFELMSTGLVQGLERTDHLLFAPDELFEMHAHLLVPMMAGWDAFFVPENRDFFVHSNHHGYVEFVSRSREAFEAKREYAKNYGWQEDLDGYPGIVRR